MPEDDAPGTLACGGFRLGDWALALPLEVLREVLPCPRLQPLPCTAAGLAGGLDLRGVSLPVLNLQALLGRPTPQPPAWPCVLVLSLDGRLLGLLADAVTGIFSVPAGAVTPVHARDPQGAILVGSIARPEAGGLVHLLSAPALMALPGLPLIDDPEPQRQARGADIARTVAASASVPMLLTRCGGTALAIDALSISSTLASPQLRPSPLSRGDCLGVIEVDGQDVPALDLLEVCRLGRLPAQGPRQALVLRRPEGAVALLVSDVIDVLPTPPEALLPLPRLALPAGSLFSAALPARALPADASARAGLGEAGQFIVLDAAALRGHASVQALARTNVPTAADHPGKGTRTGTGTGTAMITGRGIQAGHAGPPAHTQALSGDACVTYEVDVELATPIGQIDEILPLGGGQLQRLEGTGALLGLVLNRGRSIPVMCLCALAGRSAGDLDDRSRVLVVEVDGQALGFAVRRLVSIEPVRARRRLPGPPGRQAGALQAVLQGTEMVDVGLGQEQRSLRLLDLQALARTLDLVTA